MAQPLVSIIILTYANGLGYVKKCLTSLQKITYDNYEIILVDNKSTDDTVEYVKKHFPKVKLLINKKNLGFCGGNNEAVKKAKGKYVLFLNNDTTVDPQFLSPLVDLMEQDTLVGAVQPKMRQLVKKESLDACASFLTPTGFLYHYGYSQNQANKKYNRRMEIYSVKGACFLARKDLIDKIGLFDEDYFAYFEETDFCHRVWMHRYKVAYEPKSEMYHLGGGDTKNDHPISLQFIAYRNRIQTYIKNLELKNLLIIIPFHIALCLAVAVAYIFLRKPQVSLAIMRAILWNIVHIKEVLKKRRYVQKKIRCVPDSSFMGIIKNNPPLSYYVHFLLHPRDKYKDMVL